MDHHRSSSFRKRSSLYHFIALFVVIFTASLHLQADQLKLSNGDRLTGTFVRRADGKIYFRSPILGEIVIPDNLGDVVLSPVPPPASAAPTPTTAPLPLSTPNSPAPPVQTALGSVKPPWKGKIEFGLIDEHGRTYEKSLNLRARAEKVSGRDDYVFDSRYLYDQSNQITNTNKYDVSFRWRHDVSERVFGQALTSGGADRVKGIHRDAEQNLGFGYRFLQTARQSASIGSGLTFQYRDVTNTKAGFDYLGEVFQDYSFKINSRISLLENANIMYSPNSQTITQTDALSTTTQVKNYRIRFNTTLQGRITTRLSLNLRYEYEYDNAIPDATAKGDSRVSTTIGYEF